MEMNRMKKERMTKVREKILAPLRDLTAGETGPFARALAADLAALKVLDPDADKWQKGGLPSKDNPALTKELESRRPVHTKNAQDVTAKMDKLLADLMELRQRLGDVYNDDALLALAIELEQLQRRIEQGLQVYYRELVNYVTGGVGSGKSEEK
jgi:hypothetical protein